MATIKRLNGIYRVDVDKSTPAGRQRFVKTFKTKPAAEAWMVDTLRSIEARVNKLAPPGTTVGDLLTRYANEVSCAKKGEDFELTRISSYQREPWSKLKIENITTQHFASWRDKRLKEVKGSTVNRDFNLISNVFQTAIKEWKWLTVSPITGMRRPPESDPRDRRYSFEEIEKLLFVLDYQYDATPVKIGSKVGAALLFAIETAMRVGEICALTWSDVELDKRYLRVRAEDKGAGKSRSARRDVPLSTEAVRLIRQMPNDDPRIFNLSASQIDANFRKARDRTDIVDLHFHDARHEGITRLAQKLPVLDLARMVGHSDLKRLMIYYNPTGEEMATKLSK